MLATALAELTAHSLAHSHEEMAAGDIASAAATALCGRRLRMAPLESHPPTYMGCSSMTRHLPNDGAAPGDELEHPQCDLAELLRQLGFAHWHPVLLVLFQRYEGWLADSRFETGSLPDFWPVADVIGVLVHFPYRLAGSDQALAEALAECDFLARMARDERSGVRWDALSQSYAAFKQIRSCEPYWGRSPPWPREVFATWALAELQHRATGANPAPGCFGS